MQQRPLLCCFSFNSGKLWFKVTDNVSFGFVFSMQSLGLFGLIGMKLFLKASLFHPIAFRSWCFLEFLLGIAPCVLLIRSLLLIFFRHPIIFLCCQTRAVNEFFLIVFVFVSLFLLVWQLFGSCLFVLLLCFGFAQ